MKNRSINKKELGEKNKRIKEESVEKIMYNCSTGLLEWLKSGKQVEAGMYCYKVVY